LPTGFMIPQANLVRQEKNACLTKMLVLIMPIVIAVHDRGFF